MSKRLLTDKDKREAAGRMPDRPWILDSYAEYLDQEAFGMCISCGQIMASMVLCGVKYQKVLGSESVSYSYYCINCKRVI